MASQDGSGGDTSTSAAAHLAACDMALLCCTAALPLLQNASVTCALKPARIAAVAVAVEVLLHLGHIFAAPDASELLHWLVRGGEWSMCEELISGNTQLQQELVSQCYSIKNTRSAVKYEQLFGLQPQGLATPQGVQS